MESIIWLIALTFCLALDIDVLRKGKGNSITIWAVILVLLAIIFKVAMILNNGGM